MIGEVLVQRYEILNEVGQGGMGTVYRARDTFLGREVAVKVLSRHAMESEGRARLLHEARATASLNHPNIVTLHDAGEHEVQGMRLPFIVMELVDGLPLNRWKHEGLEDIIDIACQACRALEHAHSLGIIHRDIKPENILLVRSEIQPSGFRVKLMDFGLARSVSSRLTSEGSFVGTVHYIAPEQVMGKDVDGRADLYALGIMLYQLTTGQLPFISDDPIGVITQHLYAPVVPPRLKNPAISADLDGLITALLAKRPEDRPPDAIHVRQRLERLLLKNMGEAITGAPEGNAGPEALLERIVRGRMVGREVELELARQGWRKAVRGEGRLLLVSGEPGIGKSRLVRELATVAEVSGGKVLVGENFEDGNALYSAFAQIAQRALEDGLPFSLPDQVLADLITLAPALRLHFPGIPSNPTLDPASEQQRLYASLAGFVDAFSQRQPLLLVFEDVHWADSGSLSLLRHLARRAGRQKLLLVATYRESELDQSRPFQAFNLDVQRERLAERVKLKRFDAESTRHLLQTLFAEEISDEFLQAIFRETEGNPFFIEEVVKSLVESGQVYFEAGAWQRLPLEELSIPQSVRVAIQSRLVHLPEATRGALEMAAILGREFDFELLLAASAMGEEYLLEALESAEHAQLIQETSSQHGGVFIFSHALIPSTLVESLSGLRRRRMHRQAAEAIERLRPAAIEARAHHILESGDPHKSLSVLRQAADHAFNLFVLNESIHYLEQAAELAESLGETAQLIEILYQLGAHPETQQGLRALDRALALSQDNLQRARLLAAKGIRLVDTGNSNGRQPLEQALALLDPAQEPGLAGDIYATLGRYHHLLGQFQAALDYLEKARSLLESVEESGGLTRVYSYTAAVNQHLAQYTTSNEWARRCIALGQHHNNPLATCLGYEFLSENGITHGTLLEALEAAEMNRQIARQFGFLDREAWSYFATSMLTYQAGRWTESRQTARQCLETALLAGDLRLAQMQSMIVLNLDILTGQETPALAALEQLESDRMVQEQPWLSDQVRMYRILWQFHHEQEQAALVGARALLLKIRQGENRHLEGFVTAVLIGIQARGGSTEELHITGERMQTLSTLGDSQYLLGHADLAFGQAACRRGDLAQADTWLEKAISIFSEIGNHVSLAEAWTQRAALAQQAGDPQAARYATLQALALVETFPWESRAQHLRAQLAAV